MQWSAVARGKSPLPTASKGRPLCTPPPVGYRPPQSPWNIAPAAFGASAPAGPDTPANPLPACPSRSRSCCRLLMRGHRALSIRCPRSAPRRRGSCPFWPPTQHRPCAQGRRYNSAHHRPTA